MSPSVRTSTCRIPEIATRPTKSTVLVASIASRASPAVGVATTGSDCEIGWPTWTAGADRLARGVPSDTASSAVETCRLRAPAMGAVVSSSTRSRAASASEPAGTPSGTIERTSTRSSSRLSPVAGSTTRTAGSVASVVDAAVAAVRTVGLSVTVRMRGSAESAPPVSWRTSTEAAAAPAPPGRTRSVGAA